MKNKKWIVISFVTIIVLICSFFLLKGPSKDEQKALASQLFEYVEDNNEKRLKEFLKDHPSIINIKQDKQTALDVAIKYQYYGLAETLLQYGAETTIPLLVAGANSLYDVEHLNALNNQQKLERIHFIKALLSEKEMDINAKDENGNTALIITAYKGDSEIVKILLEQGADSNITNKFNENVLQAAVFRGDLNTVNAILNVNSALIKSMDVEGDSLLILAVENARQQLYDLIIDTYPDCINLANKEGRTALSIAAENGNEQSVLDLLNRGANKAIKSKENLLAYDYAMKWNHLEIAQLVK